MSETLKAFLIIFIPVGILLSYLLVDLGKRIKRGEKFTFFDDDNETESKSKQLDSNRFDLKIAKIVRKEIDNQSYEDVTWLKAFKNAKGNKQEAQALYAEYRTEELERIYYSKNNNGENFKKLTDNEISFQNNFFSGRESLTTAFWLYTFLGNLIVGIIVGMISVSVGLWVTIFLIGYLFFSTIGLWKCADNYTYEMQKKRKPYGWAIGAKIYAVINLIAVPLQIFLMAGK